MVTDEARVHEKIGQLAAKADAAHSRLDRLENVMRDDLKEIRDGLDQLNAHMNKGKGWAAAVILFSSFAGAGVVKLIAMLFKQ